MNYMRLLLTIYLCGTTLHYGSLACSLGRWRLGLTLIACVLWLLWTSRNNLYANR